MAARMSGGGIAFAAMGERLKLQVLIPHLGGGGAERVVAHLADSLESYGFAVQLVLFTQDRPGAELPAPQVETFRFGRKRVRAGWWRLLGLVWRERPDLLLSGMAHLSFMVLLLRPFFPRSTRVILRQNTTASAAAIGWFERSCYRFLYPRADAIVCQSEAMARDLAEAFGVSRKLIHVLKNPVKLDGRHSRVSQAKVWPADAYPRLLCVGRLSQEKGFDLLLEGLHMLLPRYPRSHAIVLGEGSARLEVEQLREKLGLTGAVNLPGYRSDWAEFSADADLFVLPSRFEGVPNALLEAAAEGLPLVATPCSGGVTEMLEGVPGAWLASSISAEGLAEAIALAMQSLGSPAQNRARFSYPFLNVFEERSAVAAYASLLRQVCGQRSTAGDA
jgi:glycosyltransferase involved in cell wall biosynthesis